MLGPGPFPLLVVLIAILSFSIGYYKRRVKWLGRGSTLLPMLAILTMTLWGLTFIRSELVLWQIAIVMTVGIYAYSHGVNHAYLRIMEKERLLEEEKRNENESI